MICSPGSVLHLWVAGGRGRDLGGRLLLLLQLLGRRVRVGLAALVGGARSHAQQVRGNAPALSARDPSAALRTRPAEVPLVTLVCGQSPRLAPQIERFQTCNSSHECFWFWVLDWPLLIAGRQKGCALQAQWVIDKKEMGMRWCLNAKRFCHWSSMFVRDFHNG